MSLLDRDPLLRQLKRINKSLDDKKQDNCVRCLSGFRVRARTVAEAQKKKNEKEVATIDHPNNDEFPRRYSSRAGRNH